MAFSNVVPYCEGGSDQRKSFSRVAPGLDVSKRDDKVCVRIQGRGSSYPRHGDHLGVDHPPNLALTLVNAREAKKMPGRKTDVADAEWLADSARTGWFGPRWYFRRRSVNSAT